MHSLDSTARREHADLLAREGLLDRAGQRAARVWIRERIDWVGWVDGLLLAIGATLGVAGIAATFGLHWAKIPTLGKFALLEAILGAGVLATWRVGLDCRAGKVLLTACSAMVGVLLAVYEQSYPIGGDRLNLMLLWAVLIAGWVAIGRFSPHWMLFVWISNLAADDLVSRHILPGTSFYYSAMGLLDAGFLIAAERGRRHGMEWLEGSWHRILLWGVTVWFLSTPAMWLATWKGATRWELGGTLLWLAMLALGHRQYRRISPDLTALSIGAASVGCVMQALVLRWLFDGGSGTDRSWFLAALAAVTISGALGAWLRSVASEIQEVTGD